MSDKIGLGLLGKYINREYVLNYRICKESLYKSTYKGNAFSKGVAYKTSREDDKFIWLVDNHGNEFDFAKTPTTPYYFIEDYFT